MQNEKKHNRIVKRLGTDKDLIWYFRTADGKGSRIFVCRNKAEEMIHRGISVFCRCRVMDLRQPN